MSCINRRGLGHVLISEDLLRRLLEIEDLIDEFPKKKTRDVLYPEG